MAGEFDDKEVKGQLQAWRESAEQQGERPEWFWARQRALVSSRMQEPRVRRIPTLAWAGIAATVALAVGLMVPGDKGTQVIQPVRTDTVATVDPVSDHELMNQLEDTMNSGVPDALQPASTLAQEMEQSYGNKTKSKVKENGQ